MERLLPRGGGGGGGGGGGNGKIIPVAILKLQKLAIYHTISMATATTEHFSRAEGGF